MVLLLVGSFSLSFSFAFFFFLFFLFFHFLLYFSFFSFLSCPYSSLVTPQQSLCTLAEPSSAPQWAETLPTDTPTTYHLYNLLPLPSVFPL